MTVCILVSVYACVCTCVQMSIDGINDQCVTGINLLGSRSFPHGDVMMGMTHLHTHTHTGALLWPEEI